MARKRITLNANETQKLKDDIIFLVCLISLQIGSAFYYGIRVILLFLTSIIVSVLTNWACEKISGRLIRTTNLEPVVLGALFACLLPPSANFWMVIFGALFMQIVVLLPFGGEENCHINSVAAAFCFCAISWSTRIFRFPTPFTSLPAFGEVSLDNLTTSPARALMMGGKPIYSLWEMLLGAVPGGTGTACFILIVASFIVFIQRHKKSTYMTLYTLGFFLIFSLIFNRSAFNPFTTALYELMSGSIAFGAVFMVPRCQRYLRDKAACVLFSSSVGMLSVLFRFFGGFEESFCFALLLASLMTPYFNKISPEAFKLWLKAVGFIRSLFKKKEAKAQ